MTDQIEAAQRILEGKCWHCNTLLPDHTVDCPLNPNKDVLDKLYNIQIELDSKLDRIKELIDKNKISVEELVVLLEDIQLNKFQEEEE